MSDNKPPFEYESWLLPYKPVDETTVLEKLDPNFEENVGKMQREARDSKYRRILTREALIEDNGGRWKNDIPGLDNVSSTSCDPDLKSSPGPSSTPVPSTTRGSQPFPGPSSSHIPTSQLASEKETIKLMGQSQVKRNPNQQKVEKALATPVTTLKAESIPGLGNVSSPSSNHDLRSSPGPSNIPVSIPGPKPYPSPSSSHIPSYSQTSQFASQKKMKNPMRQSQAKLNPIERKLNKALATPITNSKAESMMLKMGWSGGALGKMENGILEPIVPNLAYAISTKGFGHGRPKQVVKPVVLKPEVIAPEFVKPVYVNPWNVKPKNAKKLKPDKAEAKRIRMEKRQSKIHTMQLFKQNVMYYILEFVGNDHEIAILFDRTLHNGLRKIIHCIVSDIRELGSDVKVETDAGLERRLVLSIARKNRYVLLTQSEGNPPYRYLCLFKEAPGSMYLVTHYKLNDKQSDFVVKDEIIEYRGKGKKQRRTEKWQTKNARKLIDKLYSDNKKYNIVKESHDIYAVREIDDDVKDQYSENSSLLDNEKDYESGNETSKTDEFDETDEYDEVIDIYEDVNENEEKNKEATDTNKRMQGIVKVEAGACRTEKTQEIVDNLSDNPITNDSENNNKENTIISGESKQAKDNKDEIEPKTNSNGTTARKEFMRCNLNKCFSNFIAGEVFKEFKFLGHFDTEEFEVLNEFITDFFLVVNGKQALNEEFVGIWNEVNCKLSFKKDCNGGIVIYKVL